MEKQLDPHLWYACAGNIPHLPPPNSRVFYFPQGHAEHAIADVHFPRFKKIPPMVPCLVQSVTYLSDSDTDEVFARIRLLPVDTDAGFFENGKNPAGDGGHQPASFAKTLTQSDANNGGGFSVPRFCAETIFPRLDYAAAPPVQTVVARDVHGEAWRFRHIYRGTPRRHLLTTGWSSFVNRKKLVAGDSIVFVRTAAGDLRVGIRRFCKRVGTVSAEAVAEAAALAAAGRPFDLDYYPGAGAPEFVVRAAVVAGSGRVRWRTGIRFKMAVETEDLSRVSWFMGTVSGMSVQDPTRWPESPWRMLHVVWDEPDLLCNLSRVNPWLVELVSAGPLLPAMVRLSPPQKRPRVLPPPAAASIQGARHIRSLDLHLKSFNFKLLNYAATPKGGRPMLVLFGQPILTADQMYDSLVDTNSNISSDQENLEAIGPNFGLKASLDGEDFLRAMDQVWVVAESKIKL